MNRRDQGVLADWNDDRGFGFIDPDAGGRRVFVHVSAFPRGQRPAANDVVTYDLSRDTRNRLVASNVLYVARVRRQVPRGLPAALTTATVFLAVVAALVALDRAPLLLLAAYGLVSVVAFGMYRADKRAAERGAWRVPEAHLHAVSLLGGWPGALVARPFLRHKTTKQPFRTVFWLAVLANVVALAWLVYDAPLRLR